MNHKICIISFPGTTSGYTPISNLLDIVNNISIQLTIMTDFDFVKYYNKARANISKTQIRYIPISHTESLKSIDRILNYLNIQISIALKLIRFRKDYNICIFFIGGDGLLIPNLLCRFLNKKTVLCNTGSNTKTLIAKHDSFLPLLKLYSIINYLFFTRIIVYGSNLKKDLELFKTSNKVLIASRHFLNFNIFKIMKNYNERKNIIGYIGRLSEEKGIINFIHSLPKVIENNIELEILIAGDGELRIIIESLISDYNLKTKAKILGWIAHDELPVILNELRLLVIPSFTEGLPNILIESIACGTPVLATDVGCITDVILDEYSGFIMPDNSINSISTNILRALNFKNIDKIISNGYKIVSRDFNYKAALNRYSKIFEQIGS